MEANVMLNDLKSYLVRETLEGADQELDANTPLLEWGILDSVAMTGLLAFIEERYGIDVPDDEIVPEHFETLEKLVGFLMTLSSRGAGAPQPA